MVAYIVFNTLHEVITHNQIKNAEQQTIEKFLGEIGLNCHYVYTE
ncbi:unnamed protein product, partial [Rotaria sordida]